MMNRAFSIGLAALVAGCTTAAPMPMPMPVAPPPVAAPVQTSEISTERMSEITRTLASDAFLGRAMGTEGEQKSVDYLIQQFQAAGLEPGGTNGGWTQDVPMIRTQLQDTKVSISGA